MENKSPEIAYRYWQDRSTTFYLATRILYKNSNTPEPSAFCAFQAVENILKGALEYHGIEWQWREGHNFDKLTNLLKEKFEISIPKYFNNYQDVPRYPESSGGRGSGLSIPATFLPDLDRIIFEIISQIPDQGQTRLKRLLEKGNADIPELSENNNYIDDLREFYS